MWALLVLMFWEPAHSVDYDCPYFNTTMIIESVILSLFLLDDILDAIHRCLDKV